MIPWQPTIWRKKHTSQQPTYPNQDELNTVVKELSQLPPLVTFGEICDLKKHLAKVHEGHYFILQGGDCAETFAECRADLITTKLKILLQMSLVLLHGLRKPILRVGRMAGQYAKPRSHLTETQNGITLPSYRGDLINSAAFTEKDRTPSPQHMLTAYYKSALTLNYIRGLVAGGFADLDHPEYWRIDFATKAPLAKHYEAIAKQVQDALSLSKVISAQDQNLLQDIHCYTSHEALLLSYEEALTRQNPDDGKWYNLSTHFPWIGMRTADLEEGHLAYMRGLANPVAVKLGPNMSPDWLCSLVKTLNPHNEPGKLTLIHRMGANSIDTHLPPLLAAVKKTRTPVIWCCDPMHGNTRITQAGIKTRAFNDILRELQQAFRIHRHHDVPLGGVHFEMTGENVTECTGGVGGLTEDDLAHAYKSLVDPRLNYEQALEMALLIVKESQIAIE